MKKSAFDLFQQVTQEPENIVNTSKKFQNLHSDGYLK